MKSKINIGGTGCGAEIVIIKDGSTIEGGDGQSITNEWTIRTNQCVSLWCALRADRMKATLASVADVMTEPLGAQPRDRCNTPAAE